MLRTWLISTGKIAATLPALIALFHGLIEASEKGGFDRAEPTLHEKLIYLLNLSLWILLEHWAGYIILSIVLGAAWTLFVAQPKRRAIASFDARRRRKRG